MNNLRTDRADRFPTIVFHYMASDVVRREEGFTTGWRSLPFVVMQQIREGHYLMELPNSSPRRVDPGEAFAIPSGCRHRLSIADRRGRPRKGRAMSHWTHAVWYGPGGMEPLFGHSAPLFLGQGHCDRVGDACRELKTIRQGTLAGGWTLGSLTRVNQIGFELLEMVIDAAGSRGVSELGRWPERLAPLLSYIHENISNRITREGLAEVINLSPTRLHAVFSGAMGVAPMTYVRNAKLTRAKQLLIHSSLNVAEISRAVGIEDPYYFSRLFSHDAGVSPTAYRKRMRQSVL